MQGLHRHLMPMYGLLLACLLLGLLVASPRSFAQIPVNGPEDPIPVIDTGANTKAAVVRLTFDGREQVSLNSARLVTGRAPIHIGDPPLLRIRLLDQQSQVIEEFNAWHPSWRFTQEGDHDRLDILPQTTGRFVLPFSPNLATMEIVDIPLQKKLTSIDLRSTIRTFCEQHRTDPECALVPPDPRVTNGLQALYSFDESNGTTVNDASGVGAPLNLALADGTKAHWVPGGIVISQTTQITSAGAATKITEAISMSKELTLEAWVQPAPGRQNNLARILTLSDDHSKRNFELIQERGEGEDASRYTVRLRTSETTSSGRPPLQTAKNSVTGALQHVVYTRDALGLARIYIDGVQQAHDTDPGDLGTWDANYHLVLGNTLLGDRPWLGEYQLVALYNRALSPAEVRQNFQAGSSGAVAPVVTPTLQSLYSFREDNGATIRDVAQHDAPADLVVSDTTAIRWTPEGLAVDGPTVISSLAPATKVISAAIATNELTVEAWVTPGAVQRDAGRILTLSNDHSRRNVELFTELDERTQTIRYAVRQRTSETASSGRLLVQTAKMPIAATAQHIVYSLDALGVARIYVNGVKQAQKTIKGDFSTWNASYHLVLGNTLLNDRPWFGTYHRVVLYNRALSPSEIGQHFNAGWLTSETP